MTIRIGITGGIGSGKSVVSNILREKGYAVYDSDSKAKEIINTTPHIISSLKKKFGEGIYINNKINKPLLAEKIFNNKNNIEYVNKLVHPAVFQDYIEWSKSSKISFIESAILFESKLDTLVDKIIYVDAPVEIRIQRALERDNSSAEKIMARIKNQQISTEYAKKHSDYIIENDKTIEYLNNQIIDIIESITKIR